MPILEKVREFHSGLQRGEFYKFYALVTSMSGPPYDHILVNGQIINIKKIVRRIRITVMYPRFKVDYAEPYSRLEAREERERLLKIYNDVQAHEKNTLAKLIDALEIIAE